MALNGKVKEKVRNNSETEREHEFRRKVRIWIWTGMEGAFFVTWNSAAAVTPCVSHPSFCACNYDNVALIHIESLVIISHSFLCPSVSRSTSTCACVRAFLVFPALLLTLTCAMPPPLACCQMEPCLDCLRHSCRYSNT